MKKRIRKKKLLGEYNWPQFFRTYNQDVMNEEFIAAGIAAGLRPLFPYTLENLPSA